MDPEEGAAALVSGDVVMACLFGGNSIKAATAVGSRLPLSIDCFVSDGVKNLNPSKVSFISATFISEAFDIEFISLLPCLLYTSDAADED